MSVLTEAKNLEVLVLFVDEAKKIKSSVPSKDLQKPLEKIIEADFKGKAKETLLVYVNDETTKRVLLVGLGKNLTPHAVRTASASALQALKARGIVKHIAFALPTVAKLSAAEVAEALEMGAVLSQFKPDGLKKKTDDAKTIDSISILTGKKDKTAVEKGMERGYTIADGVNWARRLIMLPGSHIIPEDLAAQAKELATKSPVKSKIKFTVFDEKVLKKKGYGGILGVGQGSANPPRLIQLEYNGAAKSEKPIVLVGKGITFDSGGLSLKPPQAQEHMKYDKAGACSVLAAFKIITDLQLKVNLVVLVPTAENMPSGQAIRPGDILKMGSGKTVEVLNTDAEGRLILGDALYHATTEFSPRAVIDVATLTGACALAVGEAAVGIFANSKKLENAVLKASDETNEHVWALPQFDDFYASLLNSDVADLKNIGGREAGASTASIFLRHFIENKTPWVHFDIAGCGWYEGARDFITVRGASGVPIRLMVEFVERNAKATF